MAKAHRAAHPPRHALRDRVLTPTRSRFTRGIEGKTTASPRAFGPVCPKGERGLPT